MLMYCFGKQTAEYPWSKELEEGLQNFIAWGAVATNVRLLFHLCVYSSKLRQIMTVIVESILDMFAFGFMLYFVIFTTSVSMFVLNDGTDGGTWDKSFANVFADQYQILFIGTTDDMYQMRESTRILYVVETNILIIVCLNILISVVTDNYDLVMQRMEATDCRFRAELMDEIESLMHWKRKSGYEKYIVHTYYAESYTPGQGDSEHGKFRMLKQQISNMHVEWKRKIRMIQEMIEKPMNKKLDEIESRNADMIRALEQ